jgi:hypothetical protein
MKRVIAFDLISGIGERVSELCGLCIHMTNVQKGDFSCLSMEPISACRREDDGRARLDYFNCLGL